MADVVKDWKKLLQQGFELKSSGTTGVSKTLFQPPQKLAAANQVSIEAQQISRSSRVLTVCSLQHAGGLLAQTLPALSIGAFVEIKAFNAFSFLHQVRGFTHTHLTPAHCELLMQTKNFREIEFDGLFIACGSDRVSFDVIGAFVERGARFMCNWGMTEIGPVVINTIFDSVDQVNAYRIKAVPGGSLMGDRYYCDYRIEEGELFVNSPTCIYDGWFNTGDIVQQNNDGAMYHRGRAVEHKCISERASSISSD